MYKYLNKTKTVFLNLSNWLWFADNFLEEWYNIEKIKFSSSKFHKKHFKYLTDGLRGVLTNLLVFELPFFSRRLEKNILADKDSLKQYLKSRISFENISWYKIHSDRKEEIIDYLTEDLRNFKQLKLDDIFRKFRKYILQNKFKELNTYIEREIRIIVLTEKQLDEVLKKEVKGKTNDLIVYNIINFEKDDKVFE